MASEADPACRGPQAVSAADSAPKGQGAEGGGVEMGAPGTDSGTCARGQSVTSQPTPHSSVTGRDSVTPPRQSLSSHSALHSTSCLGATDSATSPRAGQMYSSNHTLHRSTDHASSRTPGDHAGSPQDLSLKQPQVPRGHDVTKILPYPHEHRDLPNEAANVSQIPPRKKTAFSIRDLLGLQQQSGQTDPHHPHPHPNPQSAHRDPRHHHPPPSAGSQSTPLTTTIPSTSHPPR
ncbi:hypothetical protein ACOMHN_051965 [Nucella lapillus]